MEVWLLNIETATTNCSVSISKNGELISYKEVNTEKYSHQENLHELIQSSIFDCNIELTILSGICLLYTSPSPRDLSTSRMPSSA